MLIYGMFIQLFCEVTLVVLSNNNGWIKHFQDWFT